jgi:BCD family chlorophyll transporter-like MFS transporter
MNWRKVVQLALVHAGVTITVIPVTSTLNRILIADLNMSALFVSVLVALPYLLSPLQVLIGNWADRHPIWGRHRSPWMVLGGLMASFGGYFTAHSIYWLHGYGALGLAAAVLVFVVWGIGVNVASVSYLSLVSDLSVAEPQWRSRAVSVMWTLMIVFIILTSITLSVVLAPFQAIFEPASQQALYTAFGMVWLVASVLVLVGSAQLEPHASGQTVQNTADNPRVAVQLLLTNPMARRFFLYMLLVLISIYAQDVVLEPFGAKALQMPVAVTTRLTSIWGVGLLLTLLAGVWMTRRFGKKPSAYWGASLAALSFGGIITSGIIQSSPLFMVSVFLVGLGCGLLTIASLSLMLDMTVPQAVGLYMGAWGVANFVGRAAGYIFSGLLRDLVETLSSNVVAGYVAVFGIEVVGLLLGMWVLRTISVEAFQRDAQLRLQDVLPAAAN